MMGEIWKTIPGFPIYEASNTGLIRNKYTLRVRKTHINNRGYAQLFLYKNGRRHYTTVHRIIALAFNLEKKAGDNQIAHNNGDPIDNRLENLRWANGKENYLDRIEHNTHQFGERNPNNKYSVEKIREVKDLLDKKYLQKDISKITGVSLTTISNIKSGKQWGSI